MVVDDDRSMRNFLQSFLGARLLRSPARGQATLSDEKRFRSALHHRSRIAQAIDGSRFTSIAFYLSGADSVRTLFVVAGE